MILGSHDPDNPPGYTGLEWLRPLVVAGLWTTLSVILLRLVCPTLHGLTGHDYVSRWSEAPDWTTTRATLFMVAHGFHGTILTVVGFTVLYQHPLIRDVPRTRLAMFLTSFLFLWSGLDQWLTALSVVWPFYDVVIAVGLLAIPPLVLSTICIARALQSLNRRYLYRRCQLETLERQDRREEGASCGKSFGKCSDSSADCSSDRT